MLNDQHLEDQRISVIRILEELHEVPAAESCIAAEYRRMSAQLAARMWEGYELQLAEFGLETCEEYSMRKGKKDPLYDIVFAHMEAATSDDAKMNKPSWFGNVDLHNSHKDALVRLDPEFYKRYFQSDGHRELIWPAANG